MLGRMKILITLCLLTVSTFAQSARQILVTPKADHPQIAKKSGLGGTVRVAVTVDQSGSVIDVGEVTGPGNVCPSVTRADVVALRESAKAAARNAKFVASESPTPSTISLNFDFPLSSKRRFEVTGEMDHSSAKDDEQFAAVAAGPASIPSGGDSKQISGGVLNGKAMSLPKPPYPPAARAVRASGAVSVQILIYEDGNVFSAAAASGHPLLRAAARTAACGAVFSPTYLEGNPVKVSGVITYNFVP